MSTTCVHLLELWVIWGEYHEHKYSVETQFGAPVLHWCIQQAISENSPVELTAGDKMLCGKALGEILSMRGEVP